MQIAIIVTGNRSLYRSVYESIDRTTHHRTATGAARALLKVERDAKDWARACGEWGSYTLEIDGTALSQDERWELYSAVDSAVSDRGWTDPVSSIAQAIERLCDA